MKELLPTELRKLLKEARKKVWLEGQYKLKHATIKPIKYIGLIKKYEVHLEGFSTCNPKLFNTLQRAFEFAYSLTEAPPPYVPGPDDKRLSGQMQTESKYESKETVGEWLARQDKKIVRHTPTESKRTKRKGREVAPIKTLTEEFIRALKYIDKHEYKDSDS